MQERKSGETTVVPVIEEQVDVSTRTVERGRVRVGKRVHERTETVDEPLMHEQTVIERVPVERWVDEAPPPRREGDTWIVSCVEEVLVVQKRLRVREEVRVRLERRTHRDPREVSVRHEEVVVERTEPSTPQED